MSQHRKLTAAHIGTYRSILEHVRDLNGEWATVCFVSRLIGRGETLVRRYLERGTWEGYLHKHSEGRVGTNYRTIRFRWSDRELPGTKPADIKKERDRVAQIPLKGVGRDTGNSLRPNPKRLKELRIAEKTSEKVKLRRLALRAREMRKTLIGSQYLVPWILARGERPAAPWANDLELFVEEVLGCSGIIVPSEDREYIRFLTAPFRSAQAKSGKNVRILLISEVRRLAQDVMETVKRFIQNQLWEDALGKWVLEPWGAGGEAFVVSHRDSVGLREPTLRVAGLDTGLTGGHYDVQIWDDTVVWRNTRTPATLKATKNYYKGAQPLLARGGKSLLLMYGTLYDPGDLYHEIMDRQGHLFDILHDPALSAESYEITEEGEIRFSEKARPRFPTTLPIHVLREMLETMGSYEFAGQYLLDFHKVRSTFLKPEDLCWMAPEEMPALMTSYVLADFASTEDPKACYTCYWLVQVDRAMRRFVRDVEIGRWEPDSALSNLERVLHSWNPRALVTEDNSQSRIYESNWQEYCRSRSLRMNFIRVPRKIENVIKHQRIISLKGPIRRGDIIWDLSLKTKRAFAEIALPQMLRYRHGRNIPNDAPDALTLWNAKDKDNRDVLYCPSGFTDSLDVEGYDEEKKVYRFGIWERPPALPSRTGSDFSVGWRDDEES